jgi:hypothetical protein
MIYNYTNILNKIKELEIVILNSEFLDLKEKKDIRKKLLDILSLEELLTTLNI